MIKKDFEELNQLMNKAVGEYSKLTRKIYTDIDPIVTKYGMKNRFNIQINWYTPIISMDITSSQQKPIPREFINEISAKLQSQSKNMEIINDKLRLTFEYD